MLRRLHLTILHVCLFTCLYYLIKSACSAPCATKSPTGGTVHQQPEVSAHLDLCTWQHFTINWTSTAPFDLVARLPSLRLDRTSFYFPTFHRFSTPPENRLRFSLTCTIIHWTTCFAADSLMVPSTRVPPPPPLPLPFQFLEQHVSKWKFCAGNILITITISTTCSTDLPLRLDQ